MSHVCFAVKVCINILDVLDSVIYSKNTSRGEKNHKSQKSTTCDDMIVTSK